MNIEKSLPGHSSAGRQARRIAVVGSNGRLGRSLVDYFGKTRPVLALDRDAIDLHSPDSIARGLEALEFDTLILSAAMTGVDYCEKHQREAYAVNADGPRAVAELCKERSAQLVYCSTDFVFDGEKMEPYSEEDPVNPINVYGSSKLRGEEYVLGVSCRNLVVRLSWLFGPGKPAFPEWIVEKAIRDPRVSLPAEKIGCPTWSTDVVGWLDALLSGSAQEGVEGVVHLCNSEPCSWQEWGQFCLDLAHEKGLPLQAKTVGPSSLDAIPAFKARRPVNSAMDTGKFTRLTKIAPRSWKSALRDHIYASNPNSPMNP